SKATREPSSLMHGFPEAPLPPTVGLLTAALISCVVAFVMSRRKTSLASGPLASVKPIRSEASDSNTTNEPSPFRRGLLDVASPPVRAPVVDALTSSVDPAPTSRRKTFVVPSFPTKPSTRSLAKDSKATKRPFFPAMQGLPDAPFPPRFGEVEE